MISSATAIQSASRLDKGHQFQLYLTDYRSLYVGDVVEVRAEPPDDRSRVPAYYASEGLAREAWFGSQDIRALVTANMSSTQAEQPLGACRRPLF